MKQNAIICMVLIVATLVVYGQALRFDFVSWDDPLKITDNAHVKDGITWPGIAWAFTTTQHAPYWHPITWLSHMVDCNLYGTDPAGHHATNA